MSEFTRELTDLIHDLAEHTVEAPEGQLSPDWERVRDLGLAGIGIAEEAGGSGGGLADLVVVINELARAGIATPIVEASTAAYATGCASADGFGTVAVSGDLLVTDTASASFAQVPFVPMADSLVIVTRSRTAKVSLSQPGVTIEPAADIAGEPCGTVRLDNAAVLTVSDGPATAEVAGRLALARSAALLGSAQGAYMVTRRYVTEREQFGAPLIKIPAVSSALAKMAVIIKFAASAVERAVSLCTDSDTSAMRRFGAVTAARVATADAATLVARSSHQLHGAVGVTQEYGLHRYTRKLWAWRDADEAARVYSTRLGATVRAEGEILLWEHISA